MRSLLAAILLILTTPALYADDGAASIAAGGLVLMRREPRITMAKEVLEISPQLVRVDYDFRNDSDAVITTEVAFPIPAYKFGDDGDTVGDPSFHHFKLYVNGKALSYQVESRAYVGKRDVTDLLHREHIDISTFGHWDVDVHDYGDLGADFKHASHSSQQRLLDAGAYDKDQEPAWTVEKKYHWTQTFPAHTTIHIRHEYAPVLGATSNIRYDFDAESMPTGKRTENESYLANEVASVCLDPALHQSLFALSHRDDVSAPIMYVDFILTTANTWKTPIEDFTLIVDRPTPDTPHLSKPAATAIPSKSLISFCWDGPVLKTDPEHVTAHRTNFVPASELRVGFIQVTQHDPQHF